MKTIKNAESLFAHYVGPMTFEPEWTEEDYAACARFLNSKPGSSLYNQLMRAYSNSLEDAVLGHKGEAFHAGIAAGFKTFLSLFYSLATTEVSPASTETAELGSSDDLEHLNP